MDKLHLEDGDVSATNVVRDLGVMIDSSLTMLEQIKAIQKSGFYYLN